MYFQRAENSCTSIVPFLQQQKKRNKLSVSDELLYLYVFHLMSKPGKLKNIQAREKMNENGLLIVM